MKKAEFFGKSDTGKIRTNNEDTFLVCRIWDDDHLLAAVIDGVGGYEGGEVAAALARDTIKEYIETADQGDCLDLIKNAVIAANNCIFEARTQNIALANMSCVLTASIIELDTMRVNIAHVGDTRLYQYTSSGIEKLTHDHSLIGYREEIGNLTEEEAMNHPQRNIISRDAGSQFLDANDTSYIEAVSYPLDSKVQILLCSDGLCDMITSKSMARILSEDMSVEAKVDNLIEEALDAGGRDNVTVVVLDLESDEIPADDLETEDAGQDITDMPEEPCAETSGRGKCPRARRWLPWVVLFVIIAGIAGSIICNSESRPGGGSEKKSADTTTVAPADTVSQSDTLSETDSISTTMPDQPDSQVHDNVGHENQ